MLLQINDDYYLDNANDLDLEQCIDILIEVSDELLPTIFNKINIKNALLLVANSDNEFINSKNFYLIKSFKDNSIVALLLAYKQTSHKLPLVLRSLLNKESYNILSKIMFTNEQNAFYINTLFVSESSRGMGFASLLLDLAKIEAAKLDCSSLYLHCYEDNEKALGLYKSYGFKQIDTVSYQELNNFKHQKGLILSLSLN